MQRKWDESGMKEIKHNMVVLLLLCSSSSSTSSHILLDYSLHFHVQMWNKWSTLGQLSCPTDGIKEFIHFLVVWF